ncbi:MFS transporter [Propionivibrio sp.]|uniref:MFS transporter n=1 Tax=Propionivibrio sp. TaxID=2212460 RepID=UPI0025FED1BB|nr:MFS transporter [Propionivibrio sp.]MBK7356441.1 MFS transporter [Propionivibrio sp.]MBK8400092.1 MFS transporter [Propionivibrio sp.]MBK8744666.1 MFS transporter [Propionivibrio sp.]MBK8893782.1 MFS transporter [Propionivibrio sp.]
MSASLEATPTRSDVTVIALVGFAHATSHFFHLVIPLLFPWLMPVFGLSYTQAGILMTVFFVISGVGQALAGMLVDRIGSKPVLLAGVLLLACSGLVLGAAQNYAMLMLAAAVAGAGNSVFHPADFTIINRRVSKARLGHAFSVHGLSGNLGWAAAPLLMTMIAASTDWRTASYCASAMALLAYGLLFAFGEELDEAMKSSGDGDRASASVAVSTLSVLASPAVWLCFLFFFLITAAFGALQNYSAAALQAMYGLSLATAASCLSAYLLGGAVGIAVGGFLAGKRAQHQIIAVCLSFGAGISLLLACTLIARWAVLPLMAVMGFGIGIAGPSRDLLVRKAATQGLGEASYGRVYGFVYSGLDIGLATAPLIFGPIMDGGYFSMLWVVVAVLQGLAVVSALRVGSRALR